MNNRNLGLAIGAGLLASALLAGCGGGDGDRATDPTTLLQQSYASRVSGATTASVLTSASFQDAFASSYLDAGTTRAQAVEAMNKDAAAISASSEFSLFPGATLTDVSVGNCTSANVCTMTGTLANNDADATSVPFSTKVVVSADGAYRLLGDQLPS